MYTWRIYYSDGTTISNKESTPEEVNPFGIVCIVQKDPERGRNIMHGWDWYYYNSSEGTAPMWWGCDLHGLLDRMLHRLPVEALLQGRTVSNDVWQKLTQEANEDLDFKGYLK